MSLFIFWLTALPLFPSTLPFILISYFQCFPTFQIVSRPGFSIIWIVIAPLNTDTRGYPALLAHQQVCQPVNLLDGHAASQLLCFCVKTLIKKSHPWSGQWPDNLSTPSSFPLIGPHGFSVSFSALRLFQAHPFPAELKDRSDKKHINFFLRTRW